MHKAVFILVLWAALAPSSLAQPPAHDPIAESVFPPELVMRYSADIALDERQRDAVKEAVQRAQSQVVGLQFDLQAEAEKLARLLRARPVDEASVLAQADRVMGLERDIKKAHLGLLVRIKNILSPAQQDKLMALRRKG